MNMTTDQFAKSVAILVMLDVIAVYAYCLRIKGGYPPSHPWSGISLILLSAAMMMMKAREDSARLPVRVFLVALAVAAGLWTLAAIPGR
jgi:hypothetical protein